MSVASKNKVLLRIDGAVITSASVPKLYAFFSCCVNCGLIVVIEVLPSGTNL